MASKNGKTRDALPRVSIIVPARNEEKYIVGCLQSLLSQDYPHELLEIIVVDGCSEDATVEIARRVLDSQDTIAWHILTNPARIKPVALNMGIKSAAGDIISVVDAHCVIVDGYITDAVAALRETGAACVGGIQWAESPSKVSGLRETGAACVGGSAVAKGEGYISEAIVASHRSVFGLGGGKFRLGSFEGYVDSVFNACWPKKIFDEVGLFDETLVRNQDIELSSRIRKHGGKIYLSSKLKSYYFPRSTLSGLWKQNFANGMWNIYTTMRSPGALSLRHFVPLVFVLTLLILGILSIFFLPARYALLGVLALYAVTSVLASAACALRDGSRLFWVLPIVFAVLHFSYGLGSLWGCIYFLLLRRKPPSVAGDAQAAADSVPQTSRSPEEGAH